MEKFGVPAVVCPALGGLGVGSLFDRQRCGHIVVIITISHFSRWLESIKVSFTLMLSQLDNAIKKHKGAMENKSLIIFNSKLVLASPETATDADYATILGVIGHEYFHNWTGNRVTCRDWFQLSLKEGLTIFRDQEFSFDPGSCTVKRIVDVSRLRNYQSCFKASKIVVQ